MNDYAQDVSFDIILPRVKAKTYEGALKIIAKEAAQSTNVDTNKLFDMIMDKENVASSGIGDGIAIPHIQVEGPTDHVNIMMTLDTPLECHAIDNAPVSVVCFMLSPKNEGPYHLRRLSRVSRMLKNETLHLKLKEAQDETSIRALLMDPEGWLIAA